MIEVGAEDTSENLNPDPAVPGPSHSAPPVAPDPSPFLAPPVPKTVGGLSADQTAGPPQNPRRPTFAGTLKTTDPNPPSQTKTKKAKKAQKKSAQVGKGKDPNQEKGDQGHPVPQGNPEELDQ